MTERNVHRHRVSLLAFLWCLVHASIPQNYSFISLDRYKIYFKWSSSLKGMPKLKYIPRKKIWIIHLIRNHIIRMPFLTCQNYRAKFSFEKLLTVAVYVFILFLSKVNILDFSLECHIYLSILKKVLSQLPFNKDCIWYIIDIFLTWILK